MLAAQSIPTLQDRKAWLALARGIGYWLGQLSHYEADPWAALTRTARWPSFIQLGTYLGVYLLNGMQASCIRNAEKLDSLTVTDAVCLLPPSAEDADFGLEIWLSSAHGKSIDRQVKGMRSIEAWESILGTYLYEAMTESIFRKSEVDRGISLTSAARVTFPDGRGGNHDSKLEVLINFQNGTEIWTNAYPDP